jgi:hypothetical protein
MPSRQSRPVGSDNANTGSTTFAASIRFIKNRNRESSCRNLRLPY